MLQAFPTMHMLCLVLHLSQGTRSIPAVSKPSTHKSPSWLQPLSSPSLESPALPARDSTCAGELEILDATAALGPAPPVAALDVRARFAAGSAVPGTHSKCDSYAVARGKSNMRHVSRLDAPSSTIHDNTFRRTRRHFQTPTLYQQGRVDQ